MNKIWSTNPVSCKVKVHDMRMLHAPKSHIGTGAESEYPFPQPRRNTELGKVFQPCGDLPSSLIASPTLMTCVIVPWQIVNLSSLTNSVPVLATTTSTFTYS